MAPPRPLLFPEREPGPAFRDIPMADLQAIQWALNGKTLPFFLNFFGLSGRQVMDVAARWQALVNLAQALATWQERPANEIGQDDAQSLFASLRRLLRFEYLDDAARGPPP